MQGYKVTTHDYRPPIQGGDPLWDGKALPFTLPTVRVDEGGKECSYGWNFCADLPTALRIAGPWHNGRGREMSDGMFTGVNHICVVTRDVDRAVRTWADKYVANAAYCLKHNVNVGAPLTS